MQNLRDILLKYAMPGDTVGIIGAGRFGTQVLEAAQKLGFPVALCDPPRQLLQSEEEYGEIHTQWGNGMGGCTYREEDPLVFLPLSLVLKRARIICVQTPQNVNVMDESFLSLLREDAVVLDFTGNAPDDRRIIELAETDK